MEDIKSAISFKLVSTLLDTSLEFLQSQRNFNNSQLPFSITKAIIFNMLLTDILTKDYNVFDFIEHEEDEILGRL